MLKSYFFVPANKERFLNKIDEINADEIVLDLEDTVPLQELDASIDKISSIGSYKNYFIRPHLFQDDQFDLDLIQKLIQLGFDKFVLPKLENIEQLESILSIKEDLKLILLVEHPSLYLGLYNILTKHSHHLMGIGIGAHDFSMNTNHMQYENFIQVLRTNIVIHAASFDLECIDTASMIISDTGTFKNDCLQAFNSGCTGKFLIHPKQLQSLKETVYFTNNEIDWAKKALKALSETGESALSAISIDGKVLERPHLNRLKQIQKYLQL